MARERASNVAESTLNGAIDASQSTITVNSATPFPTGPNFRLSINDEILLVTGVAGAVFTVTRGIEGTTAASHANAAPVAHLLTAGSMEQFCDDRIIEAPAGDYSVTSNSSRILRANDAPFLVINRSNLIYSPYMPIKPFDFATNYTGFNLGSTTYSAPSDCVLKLAIPNTAGDALRGYVTPYAGVKTFDAWIMPSNISENFNLVGICVGNGSNQQRFTFMLYNRTSTYPGLTFIGQHWTDVGVANPYDYLNNGYSQIPICLRVADNSADTLTFSYSYDGINFTVAYTKNYSAIFSPTRVGICADNNSGKTAHHWYANLWLR